MTEKVFNFAEVVSAVSQIVLDRGFDYVDQHTASGGGPCSYVEDGRGFPGLPCIVGEFWARQGVGADQRALLDEQGTIISVGLAESLPVLVTERAFAFLRRCQRSQDLGNPYGQMLAEALSDEADQSLYDLSDQGPITLAQVVELDNQF